MARINADAKQATRKRLLEAGASEFAKHGLEGANVNEISLAADSPRAPSITTSPPRRRCSWP